MAWSPKPSTVYSSAWLDVEEVGDAVLGQGQVRGEVAGERQLGDQQVDLVPAESSSASAAGSRW